MNTNMFLKMTLELKVKGIMSKTQELLVYELPFYLFISRNWHKLQLEGAVLLYMFNSPQQTSCLLLFFLFPPVCVACICIYTVCCVSGCRSWSRTAWPPAAAAAGLLRRSAARYESWLRLLLTSSKASRGASLKLRWVSLTPGLEKSETAWKSLGEFVRIRRENLNWLNEKNKSQESF